MQCAFLLLSTSGKPGDSKGLSPIPEEPKENLPLSSKNNDVITTEGMAVIMGEHKSSVGGDGSGVGGDGSGVGGDTQIVPGAQLGAHGSSQPLPVDQPTKGQPADQKDQQDLVEPLPGGHAHMTGEVIRTDAPSNTAANVIPIAVVSSSKEAIITTGVISTQEDQSDKV